MKKQNLLLTFLITCFILSCSSDDSQPNEEEQVNTDLQLYKKTNFFNNGVLTSTQEVYYDDDNKIESVSSNEIDSFSRTFTVGYSNGNVSGIIRETDFTNPNATDVTINYNNITATDNIIILISDESDRTFEIEFSDGYVNSTRLFRTSMPNNPIEQSFSRNSDNQLISNSIGEAIFEYSNFDNNKKLDPYTGVMQYFGNIFFLIFDLEVSRDNPLTAIYNTGGGGTETYFLEYDEQGYVTKVSYEESSSDLNYSENEYIAE